MKRQRGDTLISLAIGLAVMSILATEAFPSVAAHYARQQLRQVLSDLGPVRADILQATACTSTQSLQSMSLSQLPHYTYAVPVNPCGFNLPYVQGTTWGRYVSSLTFDGVHLRAVMGPSALPIIRGGTLTLTNSASSGAPAWSCTFSNPQFSLPLC